MKELIEQVESALTGQTEEVSISKAIMLLRKIKAQLAEEELDDAEKTAQFKSGWHNVTFLKTYIKEFGESKGFDLINSQLKFLASRCNLYRAEIERLGGSVSTLLANKKDTR